jgi:hypothetical protein
MTNEIDVNQDVVLLPLQTINGGQTLSTPDQINLYAKGIIFYVTITAGSGTSGVQLELFCKDPASGNYVRAGVSAAMTSPGTYVLIEYPNGQNNLNYNGPLSRTWQVRVVNNDSVTYTLSLGCSVIK